MRSNFSACARVAITFLCAGALACSAQAAPASVAAGPAATPAAPGAYGPRPRVQFVTNMGSFVVEVRADQAPKTAANFLRYVTEKHYDGTVFHRVIASFMVQGGGFDANLRRLNTHEPIEHEGRQALAAGGPRNVAGVLAMARTNDPNSATDQFFINVVDNPSLDPVDIPAGDPVALFNYQGRDYANLPRASLENDPRLKGYVAFARVVAGMDTVERIRGLPTGPGGPFASDVPQRQALIKSAFILPATAPR
jgi:peptidyl-prolyl cis-trans isomerase A (cyclophilin A)